MDIALVPVLIGGFVIAVVIYRANELFVVRAHRGDITVVRGRVPQRLLNDFGEILGKTAFVRLRGTVENQRPMVRIAAGKVDEQRLQRLRNVTGTWTVSQIRSAPKPK